MQNFRLYADLVRLIKIWFYHVSINVYVVSVERKNVCSDRELPFVTDRQYKNVYTRKEDSRKFHEHKQGKWVGDSKSFRDVI